MALRTRMVKQVTWVAEDEETRASRREELCELDGLLMQLEEVNVRGSVVPVRLLLALRRHGIAINRQASVPDLIEAVFTAQERYMRRPEGDIPAFSSAARFRRIA